MDKKNTIIGVILLLAAFYLMFQAENKNPPATLAKDVAAQTAAVPSKSVAEQVFSASAAVGAEGKETSTVLKNDLISATFTSKGAAIDKVELLKYPAARGSSEPFAFNAVKGSVPAMTLAFFEPDSELPQPFLKNFALVAADSDTVSYALTVAGKFSVTRTYALVKKTDKGLPQYAIASKTSVKNISKEPLSLREIYFCLGAVPPTASDVYGANLAFVLYDGKTHFARSSLFVDSSGFLGLGSSRARPYEKLSVPNSVWGSVKNQFFAAVFTPEKLSIDRGFAYPISIDPANSDKYLKNAVSAFVGFPVAALNAGESWEVSGSYYAGPKDLDTLFSLGASQDAVMDYGWFGFVSRPLSRLLNWVHSMISYVSPEWAWGWSIIFLTLIVRGALWPLTSVQIKSAQRMAKMQEPLKAIKEKYKDDPKRVQQETMKLYSEYGINPLAGCLPILIQLPIFIGLYYMLQTSCEIRFAPFLWIKDLSLPDTIDAIPSVFGIPLHVLPLLNAAVTFVQMHLTPTPSTDKTQAMMFKLMPVILLVFFYTFPSGLVLYWLVQSLLGILQAIIIRRGKDKVVLKKRTKPSFFQKMQNAMEQAQAAQQDRGEEFNKLPLKERMRILNEDARKAKQKIKEDRLKGTMYEKRKKNPGGRSTPPKR